MVTDATKFHTRIKRAESRDNGDKSTRVPGVCRSKGSEEYDFHFGFSTNPPQTMARLSSSERAAAREPGTTLNTAKWYDAI